MQSRRTVLLAALGAAVVTAVVVGGIAWGTIGDGGVIHGCYLTKGGSLRVIDPLASSCTKQETALSWSAGSSSSSSHAYDAGNGVVTFPVDSTSVTVVSLNLPAGDFVLVGRTNINFLSGETVSCALNGGALGTLDASRVASEADREVSVSVESPVHLESPTTVTIDCNKGDDTPNLIETISSRLIATTVDTIN
jgi:hypothetical protein